MCIIQQRRSWQQQQHRRRRGSPREGWLNGKSYYTHRDSTSPPRNNHEDQEDHGSTTKKMAIPKNTGSSSSLLSPKRSDGTRHSRQQQQDHVDHSPAGGNVTALQHRLATPVLSPSRFVIVCAGYHGRHSVLSIVLFVGILLTLMVDFIVLYRKLEELEPSFSLRSPSSLSLSAGAFTSTSITTNQEVLVTSQAVSTKPEKNDREGTVVVGEVSSQVVPPPPPMAMMEEKTSTKQDSSHENNMNQENHNNSNNNNDKNDHHFEINRNEMVVVRHVSRSLQEQQSKEKIIQLIQSAGIDVDPIKDAALIAELPTWTEVTDMYGTEPVVYGLNEGNCQRFQTQSDRAEHMMGTAGTFNTGTNLLSELLIHNCHIPERRAKYNGAQGVRWQVPWYVCPISLSLSLALYASVHRSLTRLTDCVSTRSPSTHPSILFFVSEGVSIRPPVTENSEKVSGLSRIGTFVILRRSWLWSPSEIQ